MGEEVTSVKPINVKDKEIAENLLKLQIPAYMVEAKLINFFDIPPLKDTVETLRKCGEQFFGYFIEDELCGAISYKVQGKILDIHRLIVHPNHFRKGIAKQLFQFMEEHIEGIDKIVVSTGTKNFPAVEFYLKRGFSIERVVQVTEELSLSFFEKKMAR